MKAARNGSGDPLDNNDAQVARCGVASDNDASLVNVTHDGQNASSLQLDITTFIGSGLVTLFDITSIPVSAIELL